MTAFSVFYCDSNRCSIQPVRAMDPEHAIAKVVASQPNVLRVAAISNEGLEGVDGIAAAERLDSGKDLPTVHISPLLCQRSGQLGWGALKKRYPSGAHLIQPPNNTPRYDSGSGLLVQRQLLALVAVDT